ncbi:PAS domain S-box protein [Paludibaculum fermentans]|uniref:PAS domain S-box protein n=1 Tax=Paludibaculum fermentans TaxID=1473598 RepID=UPI003EBFCAD9
MSRPDDCLAPPLVREEQFRHAVENSEAGYFLMNPDGTFRWVNPAWLRLHGFSDLSQIVGQPFNVTLPPCDVPQAEALMTQVLAGNPVRAGEFSRLMVDGRLGYHTFTAYPIVEDGAVTGIEGFIVDKKAIQNLEELHRMLFDEIMDGFAVLEPVADHQVQVADLLLLAVNPAFARWAARPAGEIAGHSVRALFAETKPDWVEKGALVLATGAPARLDVSSPELGQWFELLLFRIAPGRLGLMLRDVTERHRVDAVLQESHRLLHATQEIAGLGSYVLDIATDSWTSSSVLNEIFGIDEAFKRTIAGWVQIVHPNFRQAAADHFTNHVVARRGRFDLEYQIVRISDGQVRWVHGLGELVFGADDQPIRMIGTIQDISVRKQHETEQEWSVSFLRLLNRAGSLDELVRSVIDFLLSITAVESAAIRLREEDRFPYLHSSGLPDALKCPWDSPFQQTFEDPRLLCLCGAVLSSQVDHSHPHLRPDGFTAEGSFYTSCSPAESRFEPGDAIRLRPNCPLKAFESLALIPFRFGGRTLGLLQFGDRNPGRLEGRLIPLLERLAASLAIALEQRLAQAALRENEERYRMISENTGDVIWLYDLAAECFTYISPSARRFSGLPLEASMRRSLEQVLSPRSYDVARRKLNQRIAEIESGDLTAVHAVDEFEQIRAGGGLVDTEVVTTLLLNAQGRVHKILGVSRDITERKQTEARLMQAQKMESVGRLAGGVAHDFNNQLTVINGYSQLILATLPAGSPLRSHVEQIYAAGERAASLTKQLLAFSRKQMMNLQSLNLNQVVLSLQPMLTRLVGEDVEVRVIESPGRAVVKADLHQMEQVIMNLAVNARDAMPAGGVLLIETSHVDWYELALIDHPDRRPGRFVRLAVGDTGHGMDEPTRTRIFEPFFTTKEVGKGTGLGLSMVQGVVSQCGGIIEVRSTPGAGATFEIYLPAVAAEAPLQGDAISAAPPAGTETVLVVEDQPAVRQFAAEVLVSYGYSVIEASSASEALEIARAGRVVIDLLLTDVVMPEMDGVELTRLIREIYPDIKWLYMSGYSGAAISERSHLDMRSEFIQKPFNPEQLALKVRAVLVRQD